jgi:hypothetical protein
MPRKEFSASRREISMVVGVALLQLLIATSAFSQSLVSMHRFSAQSRKVVPGRRRHFILSRVRAVTKGCPIPESPSARTEGSTARPQETTRPSHAQYGTVFKIVP